MKLLALVLGLLVLSGCITRKVERETVIERPRTVEVVPGPQGPPGPTGPQGSTGPAGDTTIIVPRQ
jgi:hypothetical protein